MNSLMRRGVYKWVTLAFCISVLFQQTASAQGDPVEQYRIYRGVSLMNITWSPDSTHLIFQDAQYGEDGTSWGVDTAGYNRWHEFSLETGETKDSDYWPLQPLLTPEQWEDFEIYQRDGEETFVFQSPNGRFIAYTSKVTDGYYFAFGLADLETGQHRIFEDVSVPDVLRFRASSVDYNFVRWSPDGTTFVLGAYLLGPGDQLYHFSNLSAGLADIVVRPLYEPVPIERLAQWTFYPRHALDVYGDQVLVSGETQAPGGFHRESSAIYDLDSKSADEVAGKVAGAMLLPDDPSQAMSVGEDGLRRYYGTGSGVLHVGITSTWANGGAYFSPDARYVAIYDEGRGGPSDLYLFETGYTRSNPYYLGPIDTLTQNPIAANTGWRIRNIRWSSDSQSIVYQTGENVGVSTEGELTWYQYHVTTGETQQTDYWPLQPTLTAEQYEEFEIYTSPDAISFIFPSPDGQYILYAAMSEPLSPPIGIANLKTGQHHIISRDEAYNLWVPTIQQFFDGISPSMGVMWSDDSSAVAIASIFLGAGDYVHYITNLSDLDHLVVRDLLMETSGDMRPSQLFDISADGRRLLVGNNRPGTHLVFQWDIPNDTVTLLPSLGKIAGAAFYGASEDHVMYIDQEGFKIGEIDGDIRIYNPMITSIWAENGAFFSPDGQYVTIYYSNSFFDPTLYILETGLNSFNHQ